MALISFVVTAKLICVFVFAYAKSRFSHDKAQILYTNLFLGLSIFNFLPSWAFSRQFIFVDNRTGLCKNNVQYVHMDSFRGDFFCEFLFLAKSARINHSQK